MALFLVLAGPAVGSFLGVVVDRWPWGRSLWQPSGCDSCGARLTFADMVPIFSALRRRCRHCGAPIPGHLLRIEVAALGAACLAVALGKDPAQMAALALYLWLLVGLFYADLLHFRLPDPLTLGLLAAGLALAAATPGRDVAQALVSAAVGAGAFWLLRAGYARLRGREGLGLGDVKMAAGIGAATGWAALPLVTLIAAALGLAAALWQARGRLPDAAARVPFGSCLAGATLLVLLLQ